MNPNRRFLIGAALLAGTLNVHEAVRAMRADEMLPFDKAELVKWAELVKRSGAQVD